MAGHAQLKFVMTECSKTQIRLTGLNCLHSSWSYIHCGGCMEMFYHWTDMSGALTSERVHFTPSDLTVSARPVGA